MKEYTLTETQLKALCNSAMEEGHCNGFSDKGFEGWWTENCPPVWRKFKVFSARQHLREYNKSLAIIEALSIDEVKLAIKRNFNLNFFYCVITNEEESIIYYNEHLPFIKQQ